MGYILASSLVGDSFWEENASLDWKNCLFGGSLKSLVCLVTIRVLAERGMEIWS